MEITGAVKSPTVTVNSFEATDSQAMVFNVLIVILLYKVVVVKPDGALYVEEVSPPIVVHKPAPTLDSQR